MNENLGKNKKELVNQPDFFKISLVIYSVMAISGLEICYWGHRNFATLFTALEVSKWDALGLCTIGICVLTALFFGLKYFENFRKEKFEVARSLWEFSHKSLSWQKIVMLAVFSAFGEELFFRAGLQPYLGVWLTAALFSLTHLGASGMPNLLTFWGFCTSVVLGLMYQNISSFWLVFSVHFFINIVSLVEIKKIQTLFFQNVPLKNP